MNLKKKASVIGATLAISIAGITLSAAPALAYSAPRTGDHVTYYDCKGPYNYNWRPMYDCWADYDWFAEVFWLKRDGYVLVPPYYSA